MKIWNGYILNRLDQVVGINADYSRVFTPSSMNTYRYLIEYLIEEAHKCNIYVRIKYKGLIIYYTPDKRKKNVVDRIMKLLFLAVKFPQQYLERTEINV